MNIKVIRDSMNKITGFEARGHTNSNEAGKDIICAAISALLQSCYIGVKEVINLKPHFVKRSGYLKFGIPDSLNADDEKRVHFLLDTIYHSILAISRENAEYIFIEEVLPEHSKNKNSRLKRQQKT